MIYGIGTDIVQVSRIEKALLQSNGRFAEKILGKEELENYHARKALLARRGLVYLATRFAAKEAFSKAIGMGMQVPMTWHAVQTLNQSTGQPFILTNGRLQEWMLERDLIAHISISDESAFVVAFVIVEKSPDSIPHERTSSF